MVVVMGGGDDGLAEVVTREGAERPRRIRLLKDRWHVVRWLGG